MGNKFYSTVCVTPVDRDISNIDRYKYSFDYNRFTKLNKEEIEVDSNYNYKIKGTYIKNKTETKNTVVIVHGFRGSRLDSLKYADMYLNLGFNVVIYDSRYHGETGGKDISLGYYEKYDLDSIIKWTIKKNDGGIIGVHGESLGGVTALLHSELNEKSKEVSFYVSDCAYSDIKSLLRIELVNAFNINKPIASDALLFYSNIISLYKSHFSLYSISPINSVKKASTPILFIHGQEDNFIPSNMALELYNAKKDNKSIYLAPNAGHAQAYMKNKTEYTSKVQSFLKEYKIINK